MCTYTIVVNNTEMQICTVKFASELEIDANLHCDGDSSKLTYLDTNVRVEKLQH